MNVYTVPEAAKLLKLHIQTVRKLVREKRLDATRISPTSKILISEEAIKQFLAGKVT